MKVSPCATIFEIFSFITTEESSLINLAIRLELLYSLFQEAFQGLR